MAQLSDSLERMTFMQLLLLFAFLTSYVLALGGMLSVRSRQRAALLALALAVVFAALTDPWVHGALLMVFVIAGLGLFVMLTWLLARLLAPREIPTEEALAAVREDAAAVPASQLPSQHALPDLQSPPPQLGHSLGQVAKLARRVRIIR